jgi:type IV secretion system protein VirB2
MPPPHERTEGRRGESLSAIIPATVKVRAWQQSAPGGLFPLKINQNDIGNHGSLTHYHPRRIVPGRGPVFMAKLIRAAVAALASLSFAAPAIAQESFSDPQGSGVLVSALNWLQGTLLGTIATVAAVIAVAAVGFMMLTGRINWRYGVTVVLGCFILFGAASIVAGIHSTATLGQ